MAIKYLLAIGLIIFGSVLSSAAPAQAETLAYWRFEEGVPGNFAPVGKVLDGDTAGKNPPTVYGQETRPFYTGDVPLNVVPQSDVPNQVAVQVKYSSDFYTPDVPLDTFDFSPKGSNAWTVELSFKLTSVDDVSRLFGRDGVTEGVDDRGPLQILVTRKGDKFDVRAEILDGSNVFRDAVSDPVYHLGQWYNLAATADNTSLKLFIDAMDGKGYQLVAQRAIQGALNNTLGLFSIGRGFQSSPRGNISGLLDEVRVSDKALPSTQFLFAGPKGEAVTAPQVATYTPPKPFKVFTGADPDAAYFQGKFWMYITSQNGIGPKNPVFYAYSSPDLKNWTRTAKPILQFKNVPWIYTDGLNSHGAWAPSIAEKNGKYYYYYAVGPQTDTVPSRLGVAVGNSPGGPFRDTGKALFAGGKGFEAIDPMVFGDPKSGKYYMYAGGSAGAKLRVWEMADDMVSFAREITVQTPPQFTEGAFMHYANGQYYFSYSHGHWDNASYSVHYATAPSPMGPWQYRGPILQSDMSRKGPGHHSFVKDPRSGQWYIVYHRWESPTGDNPFKAPGGRSIAIQPITYDASGAIVPLAMDDFSIPKLLHRGR